MKRLHLVIVTALFLTLALSLGSWSLTVTLDAVNNTASSDSDVLEAKAPRAKGDQVGVYVGSNSLEPQSFTFKIIGLKQDDYDLYISGEYVGKKSSNELSDGIQLSIPGTIGHPDLMRCLNALNGKIKPEIDRLSKIKESEPQRVLWTLRQADDWVRSGLRSDEAYRSLDVIAAPAGSVLSEMTWRTRQSTEDTAAAITRACWLLQQARSRMYTVIEDVQLRNSAVVTMTPVTFSADYSTANGNPQVTAELVNNCNLPVSGTITYALPKGWKTDAKMLRFKDVGPGERYRIEFNLIAPCETAEPPASLPIAANVSLAQDRFEAKLKIRIIAAALPNAVQ